MPRLIWSPPALLDVQRAYRFLAAKNKDAAQRAVKAIRQGMQPLLLHPAMGRPCEHIAPEYREWLIDFGESGYVVLYRFESELVTVLAIRHQKEVGY